VISLRLSVGLAALLWSLSACSQPPIRTPTPQPTVIVATAVPTPEMSSAEVFDDDPNEIALAFATDVQDVIDEAVYLGGGRCEGIVELSSQDPDYFRRLRGFGETLKRVAERDQVLSDPTIKSMVEDMDEALNDMIAHVRSCGVTI
jgi:hypothetical protein